MLGAFIGAFARRCSPISERWRASGKGSFWQILIEIGKSLPVTTTPEGHARRFYRRLRPEVFSDLGAMACLGQRVFLADSDRNREITPGDDHPGGSCSALL